jgi:hypothetical protein
MDNTSIPAGVFLGDEEVKAELPPGTFHVG